MTFDQFLETELFIESGITLRNIISQWESEHVVSLWKDADKEIEEQLRKLWEES